MAAETLLGPDDAGHLLRRAGFGALPKEIAKYARYTRGKAVEQLLAFKGPAFKPTYDPVYPNLIDFVATSWFVYMLQKGSPLREKLVLFWHDHFATDVNKTLSVAVSVVQNALFRSHAKGSFKDLVKAVNRDAAMLIFLDTAFNQKAAPNENYAREFLELFTLGVFDVAGHANYAQQDIVNIARAFTGWVPHREDLAYNGLSGFYEGGHEYYLGGAGEYPERGPKVVFVTPVDQSEPPGGYGPGGRAFDDQGEGAIEIDRVTDIILDHLDSDGRSTVARRIARRLLEYFAHPEPAQTFVDRVIDASGFAAPGPEQWSIERLLYAIFVDDEFYPSTYPALHGGAPKPLSVKWPIDLIVSTMRLTRLKPWHKMEAILGVGDGFHDQIARMGQDLFEPPSVFGWDWETGWISSSTLLARYEFAAGLVGSVFKSGGNRFNMAKIAPTKLTLAGDIVDAVLAHFGVAHLLDAADRDDLIDFLTNGGDASTVVVRDYAVTFRLLDMILLVMQSAAYQLH